VANKESADGWIRSKPMRAMTAVLAGGLVLGGLVGLGVGYKIEQNRVSSRVTRLRTQLASQSHRTAPATTPVAKRSGLGAERVGKITAIGADTITVSTKRLGTLQLHTTSATKVERAMTGSKSAITVGRPVLITLSGREVIVLPPASSLGRSVTKVAPDSFSVTKAIGHGTATVSFAKVTSIDSVSAATRSDLENGDAVIVAGHAEGKGNFVAVEVIVLPTGSGFAT
jgi:Domain of unknown function (DUF5666)